MTMQFRILEVYLMLIKCLLRTYFINLAIETAFDKIVYNFLIPAEVKSHGATLELQRLILKIRSASEAEKVRLIHALARFHYEDLYVKSTH